MKQLISFLGVASLFIFYPASVFARTPTPGTYMLDGGSYSITLRMEGDTLVVKEPNKTSRYSKVADGDFQTVNPNTGSTYGIRVIDDRSIEAYKPVPGNVPSRLTWIESAATTGSAVGSEASEKWSAIADRYLEKSQSDPANTQSWVACSAVAMKRSQDTKAAADSYSGQMANMLMQMGMTSSPCPDVFRF